jgi:hypothetical protein
MASKDGRVYPNNTELSLSDVFGIMSRYTILCVTERRPCCSGSNRAGDWYYQNGTAVPSYGHGFTFYTSRGDDGTVRLHTRDNNILISLMSTIQFCCELLNVNDLTQKLCINICDSDCEIMSPVTEIPQMSSTSGATIGSVVTIFTVLLCIVIVATAIVLWKYCSLKANTTRNL